MAADPNHEIRVTEGKAFHRGDVVVLRLTGERRMTADIAERLRAALNPFEADTGVRFLVLDQDVELVEPRED